jgi:uncharacterized protein YfaS (alpha-2-macroglobulin family)
VKPIIYNENNEVTFSVLNPNKIVEPFGSKRAGIVSLRFQTNNLVNPQDRYLVQLKFKEEILGQAEVKLNKSMSNYTFDIKANRTMINGGLMTVNLYKMSKSFVEYSRTQNSSNWTYQTDMVRTWLEPKGEIIVIQKPSNNLEVEVTVDKSLYAPGDRVNYDIRVKDAKTQKIVTNEVLISLTITDESVFSKIEDRK